MQISHLVLPRLSAVRAAFLRGAVALTLCAALSGADAGAAQVTFRWDYTASGAAGFVLYCGTASRVYPTRVDVGNVDTYTLAGLSEGTTYYCAVTAYDSGKVESDYSAELPVTISAPPPSVDFSASPTTGVAPLSVAFTNNTTGIVSSWDWDFGDGTKSTAKNRSESVV